MVSRAGKILHLKALSRGLYTFNQGNHNLIIGDKLRYQSLTTGTALGTILDIRIVSGSLADGNAVVMLMTSTPQTISAGSSGTFSVYNERTGAVACYMPRSSSTGQGCDRGFAAAGSWVANDLLEAVSDLDIVAVTDFDTVYDPASVTEKPKIDMIFRPCPTIDERAVSGYLAPGEKAMFWLQQHILPNVPAHAAVTGAINFSWY